jgi:hypothetical protein
MNNRSRSKKRAGMWFTRLIKRDYNSMIHDMAMYQMNVLWNGGTINENA